MGRQSDDSAKRPAVRDQRTGHRHDPIRAGRYFASQFSVQRWKRARLPRHCPDSHWTLRCCLFSRVALHASDLHFSRGRRYRAR